MRNFTLGLFALAAVACSSDESDESGPPSAEQVATAQEALESTNTLLTTFETASTVLSEDASALQDQGADGAYQELQANAESSLQGCAAVSLDELGLHVDYGSPPGCTLPNGTTISGELSAEAVLDQMKLLIALELDQIVANGKDLDGDLFVTLAPSEVTVVINLDSEGKTLVANLSLSKAVTPSAVRIDGNTSGATAELSGVVYDAVEWVAGDCYPQDGSVTVATSGLVGEVIFDAATPQTGVATLQIGALSGPIDLPPYQGCPPP